jgi:PAS domain S-box-containing protein
MKDEDKTKEQLMTELAFLRKRNVELEAIVNKGKQAEEKNKVYAAGIENASEGIVFTQMNGDVLYLNQAACQIFGYTPAEMKQINISNFSATPTDRQKLEDSVREKGEFSGEINGVRKNGETFLATLSVSIVRDDTGKLIGRMGVFSDITERRQAEEGLKESEAKYRVLFYSSADGILIADYETRKFRYVNPAICKMLGYSEPELMMMGVSDVHPEEHLDHVISEFEAQARGEKTLAQDIPCKRKDGTIIHADINTTTVLIDGRKCNIGFFRDVTERKLMEQQNIQQERLRALGQMASGIAHDFNNALTPILGYTELLFGMPQILDDKEKAMSYLKLMNTTAKDASSIVMRLREFYRQRKEDEIFVPVNLNRLVKQTIELTRAKWKDQAQSDNITISLRTELQQVALINGNESELRNLLTNLIFNAVDAIHESGTITIRTSVEHDFLVLEVSDTGCGMTDEVKQRCFEPFFSTKEERGTGLGLSVVYGIIQRHEGTINIESTPGEGTTVIIRLPIPKETQKDAGQAAGAITRSLNVLLVDDKPEVRDVISQYLLVDGHTVETANNGREGLETFYSKRFDLVITDRAMPDINGLQLAALIKQAAPNKPIIMLTGFSDMMKVTDDFPEEVDHLLSKPVTLNDFREALAKVMAGLGV